MTARTILGTPGAIIRAALGRQPRSPRRILLTRVQNLGDCVVFLPTINRVRDAFPDARIDVLVGTKVGEAVFRMCPSVDGFVKTGWPERRSRSQRLAEIEDIRRGQYDCVLISTEETGSAMKMLAAGIPWRIGFQRIEHMGETFTERHPRLLSRVLDQPAGTHEADVNLQLADALGSPESPPEFRIVPPPDAAARAEALLQDVGIEPGSFLCVHAGTKQLVKRWPPEAFAGACDAAVAAGLQAAFVGTSEERPLVESVRALMREPSTDLTGRTSVPELAAVFQRSAAFLGNDSGPMHLASACGLPVAAVFVASDPTVWAPYAADERTRIYDGLARAQAVAEGLLDLCERRRASGMAAS